MVYVIGMGARGREGLSLKALRRLEEAEVLIGGRRHLAHFPDHPGEKVPVQGPLEALLDLAEARLKEGGLPGLGGPSLLRDRQKGPGTLPRGRGPPRPHRLPGGLREA